MAKRGAFIVIEGLDRSGKTTQTGRLLEQLEQHDRPVQLFKFPGELNSGMAYNHCFVAYS